MLASPHKLSSPHGLWAGFPAGQWSSQSWCSWRHAKDGEGLQGHERRSFLPFPLGPWRCRTFASLILGCLARSDLRKATFVHLNKKSQSPPISLLAELNIVPHGWCAHTVAFLRPTAPVCQECFECMQQERCHPRLAVFCTSLSVLPRTVIETSQAIEMFVTS